jgi:hypothetical protein
MFKHRILREHASIACGRYVPDCGRICGMHTLKVWKPISVRVSAKNIVSCLI